MKLEGRRIWGGSARAEALVFADPLSLLGGLDKDTGTVLNRGSGLQGRSVAGRVLVFPRGKGSTAGSYVLYSLKVRGRAPAALVCGTAEAVVATGAILSEIPMVDGIPADLFRTGDMVAVDADAGTVDLEDVTLTHVVTAFLRHEGSILVLRRSEEVGSFLGRWAGVSGHLEGGEAPLDRARQEIQEETGIRDPWLLRTGDVVMARGGEGEVVWAVHPFLFEVASPEVTLDWEHVEFKWIRPEELEGLTTVPKLGAALRSALKGVKSPATPQ